MALNLLFIIFGRKVRDKDYGPSYPLNCPRCDNAVNYHAYKWRSWFHIFWVPLIPWFSHRELVCPICQAGIELERSEFKSAKELIEDTQQYRERQVPDKEYVRAIRDFELSVSFIDEPMDVDTFGEEIPESEIEDQQQEHLSEERP